MFNPFRPKPHDCPKPNIRVRLLPVKLKCNSFATFTKVEGKAVQADWQQTDQASLSYINNKPYIAQSIDQLGLATTSLVKDYVDKHSPSNITGSDVVLGEEYTKVQNSSVNIDKGSTVTEAIAQLQKALKLVTPNQDGTSNIVATVTQLMDKVSAVYDLTVPTIIQGQIIQEQGGQISEVQPVDLQGNKLYMISGGFSGRLPQTPAYGTIVNIVFSKGSQAMSVFTTGKDTIGYISQEYGAPVTKIYLGVTQSGALLTSTQYKLIYQKSSLPSYSGNWVVL